MNGALQNASPHVLIVKIYYSNQLFKLFITKSSSCKCAYSLYILSISSDCPLLSLSLSSKHQLPANNPCLANTSFIPAIQPLNWLCTSKKAALASVTSFASARKEVISALFFLAVFN